MATKTKEYCDYIEHMKQQALAGGVEQLIVSARNLHNQLSTSVPTVPTCCNAMKSMMLEGDQYINNPRTNCGYSINLVINYDLHDMQHRKVLYEPKKRGRKKAKKFSLDEYLHRNEMEYSVKKNIYKVKQEEGTWFIYVPSNKEEQLDKMLFEIFMVVNEGGCKLSILSKSNKKLMRDWDKISHGIKTKLNMSLILIDHSCNMKEYR